VNQLADREIREKARHSVVVAGNGKEALRRLESRRADAVAPGQEQFAYAHFLPSSSRPAFFRSSGDMTIWKLQSALK